MIESVPKIDLDWEDDTIRSIKSIAIEKNGEGCFSLDLLPQLEAEEIRAKILEIYPTSYLPPL